MNASKRRVGVLLAFLAVAPGCEYLHPDPMRPPVSQSTEDRSGLVKGDEGSSLDEGIPGLLQESTFNMFKAFQEAGR
jgi:hypothetical protein